MGYEALIQALLSEGEAKAREIEVGAEAAARDLVERAAREAHDAAARRARHAADARERERRDAFAQARLRAGAARLAARHAALDEAFAEAEHRLDALASGPRYAAVLGRLADEALAEPLPDPVRAIVDERDAEAWRPLFARRGLTWEAVPGDGLRCGLEVAAAGGRIRYRNSFRSRLERLKGELVVDLERLWLTDRSGEPSRG